MVKDATVAFVFRGGLIVPLTMEMGRTATNSGVDGKRICWRHLVRFIPRRKPRWNVLIFMEGVEELCGTCGAHGHICILSAIMVIYISQFFTVEELY
jgi:hypothetical protein